MMRRPLFLSLLIAALFITGLLAAAAQETSTYTVQPRDVLDLIAASFDVDTSCLAQANDLANPNKLEVGQVLLIDLSCPRYHGPAFVTNPRDTAADQPAASQSGQGGGAAQAGPDDQTYTVEPNDTLDTIAQAFNVSVISLQMANNLDNPNLLFAGDTLVIPGGAPAYGEYPALGNPLVAAGADGTLEAGQGGGATLAPGDQEYVVQPRNTLDFIGAQFDKQVSCIAEANNLDNPHRLYAGQIILVPATCPAYDGLDFVPSRQEGQGSG